MKRILPIIILALFLVVIIFVFKVDPDYPTSRSSDWLVVHFLDVGQGDCILVQTPDCRNVLIDAGDRDSADYVVNYLRDKGVRSIDIAVITHPHVDHIGGLPTILNNFDVGSVLDVGYPHGSKCYLDTLAIIEARNISYRVAREGLNLPISRYVQFEVLWPPQGYVPNGESGLNNGSVVLYINYQDVSFLLPADIQEEVEIQLLVNQKKLKSTVLKVAHHGSNDATSCKFLEVVEPEFAVISVGADNPYGHPARATLARLHACGAKVFRTDEDGTIVVRTNGNVVTVETEK
jgi:competence protein ComEC